MQSPNDAIFKDFDHLLNETEQPGLNQMTSNSGSRPEHRLIGQDVRPYRCEFRHLTHPHRLPILIPSKISCFTSVLKRKQEDQSFQSKKHKALLSVDSLTEPVPRIDVSRLSEVIRDYYLSISGHASKQAETSNSIIREPISPEPSQNFSRYQAIQHIPSTSLTLNGHSGWVNSIVFLPDGRLVSCSSDKTIRVWSVEQMSLLFKLEGHTKQVYTIAYMGGNWLASGSEDCSIIIWDLEKRASVKIIVGHSNSVVSLKVMKSGLLASYSNDDTVKIWNPYSDKVQLMSTIRGHGNSDFIIPLGIMSNDFLVTGSADYLQRKNCVVMVWNAAENGQLFNTVRTRFQRVWSLLVLSNDYVAVGFLNGTIRIIDTINDANTRTRKNAYTSGVTAFVQLSNGNLISAGTDKKSSSFARTIKIWSVPDLAFIRKIDTGHSEYIFGLSLSPDESLLASSSMDTTIKLWPINE